MNIIEIIDKKKKSEELSEEEIDFFVYEYTINKTIPDYQASALLMALLLNGMSTYETFYLTKAFVKYSKTLDFKQGFEKKTLIDKHSSGGIGDKITIILAPLLAVFDLRMIKISGRGLGHTGGTIDKLDSVKLDTDIDWNKYQKFAKQSDCVIMKQNNDLVPSDKMIYGLRDVTGTVDSYGLIAASILSKKFIINSDYIFIDLKMGTGALMNTKKEAIKLASLMSDVAKLMKREIQINITDMNQPLGRTIGNLIEIIEAYRFLNNEETSKDLEELVYKFMSEILIKAQICNSEHEANKCIKEAIVSKKAIKSFENWIKTQNGHFSLSLFHPKHKVEIKANKSGFVNYLDAKKLGLIAVELGAGRKVINQHIDHQAGIYLNKKTNEFVHENETVATLYSSKKITNKIIEEFNNNFKISPRQTKLNKLIIKTI